jgi:DNA primase large subunit
MKSCTLEEIRNKARMPRPDNKPTPRHIPQASSRFKEFEKKLDTKITKRAARDLNLKPLDFTPPCIEYILNNRVLEGQRNNTVATLASFFHQQMISQDEARDRLEDWNLRQCIPQMDDEEVEITLNSVYSGGYAYGCSSAKILSICDEDNCPIGKGKKDNRRI